MTHSAQDSDQSYHSTLHLGCGRRKEDDAFGIDLVRDSDADLVWNLDKTPWPLPDNTFSKVIMIDVLEHLQHVIPTMEEVYRVTQAGAEIIIQSPFASSHHLWTDPTHIRGFTSRSFKYFNEDFATRFFSYSHARFDVIDVEYRIHAPKRIDRWLLPIINRRKFLYEKRFMYWYPVENIYFRLKTVK